MNPSIIEDAIGVIIFPRDISDDRILVMHCCAAKFEKIEAFGYEDFRDENIRQKVHLLLRKVGPAPLRNEMFQFIKLDPTIEKYVPKFIEELKMGAISCQEYGIPFKNPHKSPDRNSTSPNTKGGKRKD